MKLHEIFESIGLTREQIMAISKTGATRPKAIVRHPDGRPNCLICGKRINARNCSPTIQKR
jgi:hypothetical protein